MTSTWTKEVIRELKKRFRNERTYDIAEDLGISYEAMKQFASRLGLKKSKKHLRSLGRRTK